MSNPTPLVQLYAFDPTGRLPANKIVNEQQIITGVNWRDYHFIVPKLAPFFEDSIRIRYVDVTGTPRYLIKDVDWYPTHKFMDASLACAMPIWGSISFLNASLTGTVVIEYQTVGGVWVLDDQAIAEILGDRLHNPRITTWEEVTYRPIDFPVIDHEWNLVDMVGMKEVTAVLGRIEDELRNKGEGGLTDHIANVNNPHKTNKAHVGLGLVSNFATADDVQAVEGTANNLFMTPFQTKRAILSQVGTDFTNHATNTANPHNTTAAQVGAYSKVEADNKLKLKLDTTATAYDTDRVAGMPPLEFKQYVLNGVAADSLLFNGMNLNDLKLAIQGGASANAERFDGKNFAEATAAILAGEAASAKRFGGKTATEYLQWVLTSTIANSERLNDRTDVQTKAWVLEGEAKSAETFGGLDAANFKQSVLNGKAFDSAQLDGNTLDEVIALARNGEAASARNFGGMDAVAYRQNVLSGTAYNSDRFGTYTVPEFIAAMTATGNTNANAVGGRPAAEVLFTLNVVNDNWSVSPLPSSNLDEVLNATGIFRIKPTGLTGTLPSGEDGNGIVQIFKTADTIFQIYYNDLATQPNIWVRSHSGAAWGAWVAMATQGWTQSTRSAYAERSGVDIKATVTLPITQLNSWFNFSANVVAKLPPIAGSWLGATMTFLGGVPGGTITTNGTEKLIMPDGTQVTSLVVPAGSNLVIVSNLNEWWVTSFSASAGSGSGNIKRAVLKFTANKTLTKDDFSSAGIFKAANLTAMMPNIATLDAGKQFTFIGGEFGGTVDAAGVETIVAPDGATVNAIVVAPNSTVTIMASETEWVVTQSSDAQVAGQVSTAVNDLAAAINSIIIGTIN